MSKRRHLLLKALAQAHKMGGVYTAALVSRAFGKNMRAGDQHALKQMRQCISKKSIKPPMR